MKELGKIRRLRYNMPGHVHGHELVPYATDEEILEYSDLKDRISKLWNIAMNRKAHHQLIDPNYRKDWSMGGEV